MGGGETFCYVTSGATQLLGFYFSFVLKYFSYYPVFQHPHVYSPVIQGNSRMMAPPAHAQAGLVSSSGQYGAPEQTHAMYGKTPL